jgi:hypothetical protein
MKNSSDSIGNRTRDLPACSAVPQPTAPPRAPKLIQIHYTYKENKIHSKITFIFQTQLDYFQNTTALLHSLSLRPIFRRVHKIAKSDY